MARERRRVLVLGLDGATFDLLDPWFAAGELPYLKALASRGIRAPLTSVYPPKTIPAWYSFATGQDPGTLGIFGFTEPDGGPGRSKIVQTFRPYEAVWDLLSRQGVTVGVMDFPMRSGYPINGFLLPGMLEDRPPSYPKELRAAVEARSGLPYLPELPAYREAERGAWMARATQAVERHARYAELLCEEYRPGFLFALFRETDRVQHQHWAELTRPLEEVPEDLKGFYRAVDSAVGRIDRAFRSVGGPATTLVISDHGHGPALSDFFTNRWLAQEGYLLFKDGPGDLRRRMSARLLLWAQKFGPTRWLSSRVADLARGGGRREKLGQMLAGQGSFEAMARRVDWDRTVAYSYPVPEGIYLNRYNPHLSPEQGRAIVAEMKRKLEAFGEARIEVLEPRTIYKGKNLAQAPAILLRIDGLATEPRMDFSYPRPMLKERPGYFYGSGIHRMDGIFIASGDGIGAPGRSTGPFSLLDVAPTVLDLMGYPVPPQMSGHPLGPTLAGA
jgi:predicted AlkP superfamily phosphohydrolase/phosphomutase